MVDFARRNLNLFKNDKDAELWVRLGKNVQIMLPGTNVVIIVEKSTEIHFSETMVPKVLDYDHGASVIYSDGFKIYNLRGVPLSEENYNLIISRKLTATDIAKLSSDGKLNADQAVVAWQFLGTDNLLKGMDAKKIAMGTKHKSTLERLGKDKCREKYLWAFRPETELYQVDNFMKTGRTEYCIKMWHPTIEDTIYVEWVEPSIGEKKDADLAQAVAFSIEKKDYMEAYEA